MFFDFGKRENLRFSVVFGKREIFPFSENGKPKKSPFSVDLGKPKKNRFSVFGKRENLRLLKMNGKPAFKKGISVPFSKAPVFAAGKNGVLKNELFFGNGSTNCHGTGTSGDGPKRKANVLR